MIMLMLMHMDGWDTVRHEAFQQNGHNPEKGRDMT